MITLTELAQKLGTSKTQTRKLTRKISQYTPKNIVFYEKTEKGTLYDFDLVVEWIQKLKDLS